LSGPYQKKWRDRCVLFLDDCFDREIAVQPLLDAGFARVETFLKHFPRQAEPGKKEESVKDPRVIRLCNQHGWMLVTNDSNIRFTHVEEIKKCEKLAILATSHNSADDPDEWIAGLASARTQVEREFKKRKRPWYAQFNRDGKITTIYTVTDQHCTSRRRPNEV